MGPVSRWPAFGVRLGVVMMSAAVPMALPAQERSPGAWRQYASAADAGFSAAGLDRARHYADSVRSGAVMAVYRGAVLAAWGDISRTLELHSVRKSIVSALFGIAVGEGKVDTNSTLGALGIDDRQPLTDQETGARIRDLLAARSGVYLPASYAGRDQDQERPPRGSHPPGTHFFYNNWDFNVLGVIYERQTDPDLYDGFRRRLAEPLGMEDWQRGDGFRVYEPGNSNHPAHTFRLSTRDLARFGQLYLQRGAWNGRTIVPAGWVTSSTRSRSDFGGGRGYGHLWWTYAASSLGTRYPVLGRYDVFAASGTGGQFVLVVPGADLVIVHRGDTDNGREVAGRDAWMIAELILASRESDGEFKSRPALGPVQPVPFTSQAPPRPRPKYVVIDSVLMSEYAGEYVVAPDVLARVFVFRGRLFGNFPRQGEAELLGLSTTEFTIMPVPGVRVRFERDASGRVASMDANLSGQRFHGVKR